MKPWIAGVLMVVLGLPTVGWAQEVPPRPSQAACDAAEKQDLVSWALMGCALPMPTPPPTTRPRSEKLGIAGAVTILAGVAMMLPAGDTYRVLGDDYCVNTYSVDYGSCSDPTLIKVGLLAVGAGSLMVWIGTRRVAIHPLITTRTKAMSATLRW